MAVATIDAVLHLRLLSTELEAAITLAMRKPRKQAVHRLRTLTRRLEAQLLLLRLVRGGAAEERGDKGSAKLLKRLRRTAGAVRDLDVQRGLLDDLLEKEQGKGDLWRAAESLRHRLKRRRRAEAKGLERALERDGPKLAEGLESVVHHEEAQRAELAPKEMAGLLQRWYAQRVEQDLGTEAGTAEMDSLDAERMHAVRKTAKLARYLAESGATVGTPGGATGPLPAELQRLAKGFEDLQDAGGTWHDAMTLADTAEEARGKKDALTVVLRHRSEQARQLYAMKLEEFRA